MAMAQSQGAKKTEKIRCSRVKARNNYWENKIIGNLGLRFRETNTIMTRLYTHKQNSTSKRREQIVKNRLKSRGFRRDEIKSICGVKEYLTALNGNKYLLSICYLMTMLDTQNTRGNKRK